MEKIDCILLIDDNDADNVFHKIIIQEAEICNHIRIAKDGIKALEYLENADKPGNEEDFPKACLIFLDINMPRMNGFEFLEEYYKLDDKLKTCSTIVMLTTSLNPDDRERAGTFDEVPTFLIKPLTVEIVQEIADKYFNVKS